MLSIGYHSLSIDLASITVWAFFDFDSASVSFSSLVPRRPDIADAFNTGYGLQDARRDLTVPLCVRIVPGHYSRLVETLCFLL